MTLRSRHSIATRFSIRGSPSRRRPDSVTAIASRPVAMILHRRPLAAAVWVIAVVLLVVAALVAPTPATAIPVDDANFVEEAYEGLLGRQPDAEGLAFWTGRLADGETRSRVVAQIGDSVEHRELVVRVAYREILDRSPDPGGLEYYSAGIIDRLTARSLRAQIFGSIEFYERSGGTNEDFLAELYQRILVREPDSSGRTFWLGQLANGRSRLSVAAAFLASAESIEQPSLSIINAIPAEGVFEGELSQIRLELDRPVDASSSAMVVAVDGRQLAGSTRGVNGAPEVLRFLPAERPVTRVGRAVDVVVTVFAHDGTTIERSDYRFAYLPSSTSITPGADLMVAFYGHPRAPVLGVAGEGTPAQALDRLLTQAAPYEASGKTVVPVFEMIATLVTASPGPDGLYRSRATEAELRPYLDTIRTVGGRMLLDIQPGRASVVDEAKAFEALLLEPDVGLALDPEWVVGPTQTPAGRIGTLDAAAINEVSAYLDALVEAAALPPKILIVHRFRPDMVTNTDAIISRPGVRIIFHADGEGGREAKIGDYDTLMPPRFERGIKIFYDEDVNQLNPTDILMLLDPVPVFVSYQ